MKLRSSAIGLRPAGNGRPASRRLAATSLGAQPMRGRWADRLDRTPEMDGKAKPVDELTDSDLERFPVWAFVNDDSDELLVRPVVITPVDDLDGCLVATSVLLADKSRRQALVGNISVRNPRATQHFLTLSMSSGGRWFDSPGTTTWTTSGAVRLPWRTFLAYRSPKYSRSVTTFACTSGSPWREPSVSLRSRRANDSPPRNWPVWH